MNPNQPQPTTATAATHTPGPWKANRISNGFLSVRCNGDRAVAVIYGDTLAEEMANARLIAAAPDMFTALGSVRRLLDRYEGEISDEGVAVEILAAAIAKATA